MNSSKNTAVIVGILFIIGTVAGILSVLITGPFLDDPGYLVNTSANETRVILGALLVLTMGFALAMVPVAMFPIFKRHNETLALGAVLFRGALETVAYIAIAISWLLLLTLSWEYIKVETPDTSLFQLIGTLLMGASDWMTHILAIVFSLGALMIYWLFFQTKLIPRWLSIWGIVGSILYLGSPLLGLFGFVFEILMVPLALQEMVLAVWLIFKGFDPSALASLSIKTDTN